MMIRKVMQTIESSSFEVRVNIASNFKMFEKIVQEGFVFRYLVTLLVNEPENIQLVLSRTIELSNKPIDSKYENPFDTALTVYLLALESVNLEVAQLASSSVLKAKNCWWSEKLATSLNAGDFENHELKENGCISNS